MIRFRGLILLGFAGLLLGAEPASERSTARAQRLHGNTIVVFDGSGSMYGQTEKDYGKIAVARIAAVELIGKLVAEPAPEVGLVVFGARFDWQSTPRDVACRDAVVAEPRGPIAPASVRRMQRAITAVVPRGQTPLGRAVELAVTMLGPAGGSIVVVTDMEETCEPPGDEFHACQVLERTNKNRGPADRVYLDSIVLLAARNMNMAPVEGVRDCTGAKILKVGSDTDARRVAAEIARGLTTLAGQGDRSATRATPQPTAHATATGRVFFLDRTGHEFHPSDVDLRFVRRDAGQEVSKSAAAAEQAFQLEHGFYQVVVSRGKQTVMEHPEFKVTGAFFELFLTLDQ